MLKNFLKAVVKKIILFIKIYTGDALKRVPLIPAL